jgi:hypothetical protein
MLRSSFLAILLATPVLHAEPLTQADREALMEKLDALRDDAKTKALGRMGNALTAFKAGMASDDAAAELYLKCLEKEFEDQKLSSQDFRERKRHESERLDREGTKRCLRHQLRWLVLTLEAAEKPDQISALVPRASEAMESIFDSPAQFEMNVEALRQPVTQTIFAKAYQLDGLKVEKWPLTPLDIDQVFEQVFFPPLRAKQSFESLREQWMRRIRYEGIAKKEWRKPRERGEGDKDEKTIKRESSVEYEKFVAETQPELMWQMEMDLYKAGDQKRAAVRMLEHIQTHVTHPKAREWAAQFRGLIDSAKGAETADKTDP